MSHTYKTIQLYALTFALALSANVGFAQITPSRFKAAVVAKPRGSVPAWQRKLDNALPLLGHRNWIVIADAAYPKQSAPGIETIYTGGKQIDVLKKVLKAVEGMPHVYAAVQVDHELDSISEKDAPGITAYRDELKKLLERQTVEVKPHEEIISQLDEGSKLFNVLLLKTDMTLPYTSVFLRLECGYWTPEAEARLRETLAK